MIVWATVISVSPFRVKFDIGNEISQKTYKIPKWYTPILNDKVCFLYDGKQYVCLGAYV